MCLILIAVRSHPIYRLILTGNRDEYYDRPTSPASFWDEFPGLLAGRDLLEGGTWLGVARNGKMAAITNYRDSSRFKDIAPSRGKLVSGFLSGMQTPSEYIAGVCKDAEAYNGFNLVVGEKDQLFWYSNRGNKPRVLLPGIYGLSNSLLDTPWPKVQRGKEIFCSLLSQCDDLEEPLFEMLADRTVPDDESLPDTGVGLEWERILSPLFIKSPGYGTRSSSLLFVDIEDRVVFIERTFNGSPDRYKTIRYEFEIQS